MALLHRATLTPTKAEMLSAWVPLQPWYVGPPAPESVQVLGAFRFDDPADRVGLETFIVQPAGGPVLQVPITYRDAPLPGAEDKLVSEMQHSVLGPRFAFCGCDDPVYVGALLRAVLTGDAHAPEEVEVDGEREVRESTTFARGSGVPGTEVPEVGQVEQRTEDDEGTVLLAGGHEITVFRVLQPTTVHDVTGAHTLTGRWPNHSEPALLARVR
ncbi:maltokinase N-terminal cap-like domain-containing protein [Nocardioides litoris]|uniref:maltokinase N-terminal cap-like domain-containing protein n=1 Tax=Nocardioides litoris TaxID=1926648 RepID=UPI001121D312|nr:hypothetical protein [Nocardioides litoris]